MWTAALCAIFQEGHDLSADFEVPQGLEVTLWAETPQLYNPTAIDVDWGGRVWVTEAVNYRLWNNPEAKGRPEGDRVVVLEDTDRDGRCDSSRVYVQDPELVAPLGILVLSGYKKGAEELSDEEVSKLPERVFVSCSPSIFVFQDQNQDGDAMDAGEKQVFLTGFGGRDHDHGVHSLVTGSAPRPDGSGYSESRLFFAVGNAGPHVVTDRSGWTLRSGSVYCDGGPTLADNKPGLVSDDGQVYTGGLVLSVRFDGTGLRVEAQNFRNPYEVALDLAGELYTFDNDDEVSACRASWVLRGGNYGFFSPDGARTWRADQRPGQSIPVAQWHQEDPGVIPCGTITGAGGPTGVHFYSEYLISALRGQLLCADAGRGEVFAFEPICDGFGLRLDPRPSLIRARAERTGESARWFRPSDVDATHTDGEVFIADWYDPGVGGHGMGDAHAYGRILRVVPKGYPPANPKEGKYGDVFGRSSREGEDRRSELALARQRSLDDAELVRLASAYDGKDRVYLEAFGLACEGKEDALYPRLEEELGGEPREWDARFAGLAWRLHPPRALPAFVERALYPLIPSAARRQALDAIAFMKTREAAEAMANLALALPEALQPYAAWWLENRATNDWASWVDRAALGGELADAELVWRSGIVRKGTYEVDVDVRDATKLWLVVSEGEHGIDYDWADWLAPRFEGAGKPTKLVDLDWLEAKTGWGTTQEGKNCEGGPLVVAGKKHADGIGTHARSEIAYDVPAGVERFRATAAPDDMGSRREGSTNELEFQVWLARPPAPGRVAELVSGAFGFRKSPEEHREALRALALDPEGALVLIQKAERTELDAATRALVAELIFQNPDLGVRARASAHFRRPDDRPRPAVEELLALPGDAGWGRDLFLEPRAQCATCHAYTLGGRRRGGDIGPELTGVRHKYDAARLFDAILNPSAVIAHGFETWRVETEDGALVAGFLLADGPTVILKDTQGKRHAIPADEIVERRQEKLSVMPDGIAAGLTDQELADLVAFLRADPAREPSFGPEVTLFNGKDFSGWTHYLEAPGAKLTDVWSIRDGAIACKGEPAGYLRTEAEFTNFELTLEWRFDPAREPGNSGVLLRKVGDDKIWPKSIEAQLQHKNAGDIWNIDEFPMAVDAERTDGRHTARRAPCSEKPVGEWNRYRIRLDHDALTLEVNGVLQNTASWCQEVSGPICLQSEGAAIEFKNLRLREILN